MKDMRERNVPTHFIRHEYLGICANCVSGRSEGMIPRDAENVGIGATTMTNAFPP